MKASALLIPLFFETNKCHAISLRIKGADQQGLNLMHPGLRGLKKETCTLSDLCEDVEDVEDLECHPYNGKKIAMCHYDEDLDKFETLCVAIQGACNQINKHPEDYCGNCTEEVKDEITYVEIPETGEKLPRCTDEAQVCSGGEFCLEECLECADRGTTMAIEMTVKVDGELSPYTFSDIENVTGLNETQARDQLIPLLNESFPGYWEMLGKEITYKVCMKNVTWLNDPHPNSTQRDQINDLYTGTNITGKSYRRYKKAFLSGNYEDGYEAEFCLLYTHPQKLFADVSGGVFPSDTNYFSTPAAFKIETRREYDLTDKCTKNSLFADFLLGVGTRVIVGGTDPTATVDPSSGRLFTPFALPKGVKFGIEEMGCKEEVTLDGMFIELPGGKDLHIYSEDSSTLRNLWGADLYHPVVEEMALTLQPNASLHETSVMFSVYSTAKSLHIYHEGCPIYPTVCHHNEESNRWHNVKMSVEMSDNFTGQGDYEAGCDNYHTQKLMCHDHCGPPPSCKTRSCSVNKLFNDEDREEYEIDCQYEPVVCSIDDPLVNQSSVESTCDEATNECILVCKDDNSVCNDMGQSDCKCRFCHPPSSVLVSYKGVRMASDIEHYIRYINTNNDLVSKTLKSLNLTKGDVKTMMLAEFTPASDVFSGTQDISIDVCMNDAAILEETATISKSFRYYGSVGRDVSVGRINGLQVCPSIGYTVSSNSTSQNAYLDALTGHILPGQDGLSNIDYGTGSTLFRVLARRSKKYDGNGTEECKELIINPEFSGFLDTGMFTNNEPIYRQVLKASEMNSSKPVWYPLPRGGHNGPFKCDGNQSFSFESSGGDKFILLPGDFDISSTRDVGTRSHTLDFDVIVCNYVDTTISAAIAVFSSKPCIIVPTKATVTESMELIPFGC